MPKYVTIGYGDEDGYNKTPQSIRNAAHQHDEQLSADGAIMGVAGKPVQVRNPEASGIQTQLGPFMSSDLPLAGFAIIEAANLEEAVKQVSGSPCSVAWGVVEVWPLKEST